MSWVKCFGWCLAQSKCLVSVIHGDDEDGGNEDEDEGQDSTVAAAAFCRLSSARIYYQWEKPQKASPRGAADLDELVQWFPKCGPWSSSVGITRELVRSVGSKSPHPRSTAQKLGV